VKKEVSFIKYFLKFILQIIWCGPKLKDEREIILYLNKNDTSCSHFYEVLHDSVELSPEGSGKFRYCYLKHKFSDGQYRIVCTIDCHLIE